MVSSFSNTKNNMEPDITQLGKALSEAVTPIGSIPFKTNVQFTAQSFGLEMIQLVSQESSWIKDQIKEFGNIFTTNIISYACFFGIPKDEIPPMKNAQIVLSGCSIDFYMKTLSFYFDVIQVLLDDLCQVIEEYKTKQNIIDLTEIHHTFEYLLFIIHICYQCIKKEVPFLPYALSCDNLLNFLGYSIQSLNAIFDSLNAFLEEPKSSVLFYKFKATFSNSTKEFHKNTNLFWNNINNFLDKLNAFFIPCYKEANFISFSANIKYLSSLINELAISCLITGLLDFSAFLPLMTILKTISISLFQMNFNLIKTFHFRGIFDTQSKNIEENSKKLFSHFCIIEETLSKIHLTNESSHKFLVAQRDKIFLDLNKISKMFEIQFSSILLCIKDDYRFTAFKNKDISSVQSKKELISIIKTVQQIIESSLTQEVDFEEANSVLKNLKIQFQKIYGNNTTFYQVIEKSNILTLDSIVKQWSYDKNSNKHQIFFGMECLKIILFFQPFNEIIDKLYPILDKLRIILSKTICHYSDFCIKYINNFSLKTEPVLEQINKQLNEANEDFNLHSDISQNSNIIYCLNKCQEIALSFNSLQYPNEKFISIFQNLPLTFLLVLQLCFIRGMEGFIEFLTPLLNILSDSQDLLIIKKKVIVNQYKDQSSAKLKKQPPLGIYDHKYMVELVTIISSLLDGTIQLLQDSKEILMQIKSPDLITAMKSTSSTLNSLSELLPLLRLTLTENEWIPTMSNSNYQILLSSLSDDIAILNFSHEISPETLIQTSYNIISKIYSLHTKVSNPESKINESAYELYKIISDPNIKINDVKNKVQSLISKISNWVDTTKTKCVEFQGKNKNKNDEINLNQNILSQKVKNIQNDHLSNVLSDKLADVSLNNPELIKSSNKNMKCENIICNPEENILKLNEINPNLNYELLEKKIPSYLGKKPITEEREIIAQSKKQSPLELIPKSSYQSTLSSITADQSNHENHNIGEDVDILMNAFDKFSHVSQ